MSDSISERGDPCKPEVSVSQQAAPPLTTHAAFLAPIGAARFLLNHFGKLAPFVFIPALIATLAMAALFWGAVSLASDMITPHIPADPDTATWLSSLLTWIARFAIWIVAAIVAAVLSGPLFRVILSPFLGSLAERVWAIETGEVFSDSSLLSAKTATDILRGTRLGLSIAVRQLPLSILAVVLALVVPGGAIVSWLIDMAVNAMTAPVEYFSVLLSAGPHPLSRVRDIKREVRTMGSGVTGFRFGAAVLLTIPFLNIVGMLLNTIAAARLLAAHHPHRGRMPNVG